MNMFRFYSDEETGEHHKYPLRAKHHISGVTCLHQAFLLLLQLIKFERVNV